MSEVLNNGEYCEAGCERLPAVGPCFVRPDDAGLILLALLHVCRRSRRGVEPKSMCCKRLHVRKEVSSMLRNAHFDPPLEAILASDRASLHL